VELHNGPGGAAQWTWWSCTMTGCLEPPPASSCLQPSTGIWWMPCRHVPC